jgi:hypothetical protein
VGPLGKHGNQAQPGVKSSDEEPFAHLWHTVPSRVQNSVTHVVPQILGTDGYLLRYVPSSEAGHVVHVLHYKGERPKFCDETQKVSKEGHALVFDVRAHIPRNVTQLCASNAREGLARWSTDDDIDFNPVIPV